MISRNSGSPAGLIKMTRWSLWDSDCYLKDVIDVTNGAICRWREAIIEILKYNGDFTRQNTVITALFIIAL